MTKTLDLSQFKPLPKIAISGPSGAGKTTLVKSIADMFQWRIPIITETIQWVSVRMNIPICTKDQYEREELQSMCMERQYDYERQSCYVSDRCLADYVAYTKAFGGYVNPDLLVPKNHKFRRYTHHFFAPTPQRVIGDGVTRFADDDLFKIEDKAMEILWKICPNMIQLEGERETWPDQVYEKLLRSTNQEKTTA